MPDLRQVLRAATDHRIRTHTCSSCPPITARPARPIIVERALPAVAPTPPPPAAPLTIVLPQLRPFSCALPPRKRLKPSHAGETRATRADETGATLADGPTTGPPPTDDETSPLA